MKSFILTLVVGLTATLLYSQDVSYIDLANYQKGVNVSVITGFTTDSAYYKVIKLLKSKGLEFDVTDKENGIITTKPRVMTKATNYSYSLKVYLEPKEIKCRVFAVVNASTTVYAGGIGFSSEQIWEQGRNSGLPFYKWGFKYLVHWTKLIAPLVGGTEYYDIE